MQAQQNRYTEEMRARSLSPDGETIKLDDAEAVLEPEISTRGGRFHRSGRFWPLFTLKSGRFDPQNMVQNRGFAATPRAQIAATSGHVAATPVVANKPLAAERQITKSGRYGLTHAQKWLRQS